MFPAMTPSRFSIPALAAVLVLSFSASVAQQRDEPEPAQWDLQQINERFALPGDSRLEINNPYGNVRIRSMPAGAEIEVTVNLQTVGDWAYTPIITRDRSESGVLRLGLGTREAPDTELPLAGDGSADGHVVRADITIGLPDRWPLAVFLAEGDFTMHGATYPLTLRAESGNITLRTSGELDVLVSAGAVRYFPPKDSRPAGGRIQTSSAKVDVVLAAPDMLNYHTVSGAAVTSDSQRILASRSRDGRVTEFQLSESAGILEIQTDTGPIRLVSEGFR